MATEFKLPEVSEGVEQADIAEIRVSEGDAVEPGQVVMELETEKAVVELPCPHGGTVTKIHVKPGESVAVGTTLLTIDEAKTGGGGEDGQKAQEKGTQRPPAEDRPASDEEEKPAAKTEQRVAERVEPEREPERRPAAATQEPATRQTGPDRAEASREISEIAQRDDESRPPAPAGPATRRLARELGVDLHRVEGSGTGGRIVEEDLYKHVRSLTKATPHDVREPMGVAALPDFSKQGPVERVPMNKIARAAAANLSLSWRTIPHVTQHDLADITDLEAARKQYMATVGKDGPKVTMTAIMIKAVIGALKAFPQFNASIDAGTNEIVLKRYYHIGVAVDTEYGLLVPVIHDADKKSILQVAGALTDIAERARERKLSMEEMQGATFTITNLGGIGGTYFTPIVNHPEVAILGMSRAIRQLQMANGQPVERLMLPLSLSYDHRVINGADAARFIVKLSGILSDFLKMIMEC